MGGNKFAVAIDLSPVDELGEHRPQAILGERLCHGQAVVVTHHPFDLPRGAEGEELVHRADMAMGVFAELGVDLLMAGHLHMSHAGNTQARYKISEYAALVVQAGTATSTRGRGEVNSFNVIRIEPLRIEVDRYGWDSVHNGFQVLATEKFMRSGNVWTEVPDGMMAAGI